MRQRELSVAAWLAFTALESGARERLLTLLEALADSFEARLQPFGFDLSDESPEQMARREAPWLLPVWSAARAISQRCFMAGDASLAVVVRERGASEMPELADFDPFAPDAGNRERRLAKFLSWPISASVRVKPSTESVRMLRQRCGASGSTLALLIDARAQAVDISVLDRNAVRRLQELRHRLSRFARRSCDGCESLADLFDALKAGLPRSPALGWLDLAHGEALVVPRLSAVVRRGVFLREVQELSES